MNSKKEGKFNDYQVIYDEKTDSWIYKFNNGACVSSEILAKMYLEDEISIVRDTLGEVTGFPTEDVILFPDSVLENYSEEESEDEEIRDARLKFAAPYLSKRLIPKLNKKEVFLRIVSSCIPDRAILKNALHKEHYEKIIAYFEIGDIQSSFGLKVIDGDIYLCGEKTDKYTDINLKEFGKLKDNFSFFIEGDKDHEELKVEGIRFDSIASAIILLF